MNKIATLAKIATRLDSLGLTKEADILDGLIRKLAGEGEGEAPQAAGQKYIDAYGTSLSNRDQPGLIAQLIDELGSWDGTTDSGDMFSTGTTKIESIIYYLCLNTSVGKFADVLTLVRDAGFDTSKYPDIGTLLEDEDDGLAEKCKTAWNAGFKDYAAAHPPAPEATVAPVEKPRAPVKKDWPYYIRNTPTKDGVGGQQVADAWGKFTQIKDIGFTPDYNSFVAWWKQNSAKSNLVSPAQVAAALNRAVASAYSKSPPKPETAAEIEATRRKAVVDRVAGGVPAASEFKEDDSDMKDLKDRTPSSYTVPERWNIDK